MQVLSRYCDGFDSPESSGEISYVRDRLSSSTWLIGEVLSPNLDIGSIASIGEGQQ